MSVGMVLLTAAAILVFFGVAQRVLDKMYLSDRAALLLIALMFFGTLIPNLKLGTVELSIGGALIPAGVCVYLLIRAGTWKERLRALRGRARRPAGSFFAVSAYLLPDEPESHGDRPHVPERHHRRADRLRAGPLPPGRVHLRRAGGAVCRYASWPSSTAPGAFPKRWCWAARACLTRRSSAA